MTVQNFPLRCRQCGLKARTLGTEPPDLRCIELDDDFATWCRVAPQPAEPGLCPELRFEANRIQRFWEIGYLA